MDIADFIGVLSRRSVAPDGGRAMVIMTPEEWDILYGYLIDIDPDVALATAGQDDDPRASRANLVEAEHSMLMSMVEKAASTLRDLADMDDEGSPRLMVIAAEAKRTLKAMREIGGMS